MAERTMFLAASVSTTTMPSTNQYLSTGRSMTQPNSSIGEVDTEPDGELLVNHLMRMNAQSRKNCAASVATARYRPLMRRLGMPNTMPTNAETPPASTSTIRKFSSGTRTVKL